MSSTTVFEQHESEVRSYCRSWPTEFHRAEGSTLYNTEGRAFIDFFAGAGALNYGHNPPEMIDALTRYMSEHGIIHSLDMNTSAKRHFIERFVDVILKPRGLDYKLMFPGPTGTNSVEAALKLARKVTGREAIVSFTNAFHGMTLGSLAVTGNSMKRGGAGVPLNDATTMPFCNYMDDDLDSLRYFEALLDDEGSGVDKPAAVIVETLQGEGGLNVASTKWLRALADLCKRFDVLLIVDDIQMGCGRTGPFFSFERAGIVPDIVTLSKSLSGSGLPMALTLLRPDLDIWAPGEHNGTFRGNNAAFVTAAVALEYWTTPDFERSINETGETLENALLGVAATYEDLTHADVRGVGCAQGLTFPEFPELAGKVAKAAFDRGLLLETSGARGEVAKLMPPLTISADELTRGLDILDSAMASVMEDHKRDIHGDATAVR